VQLVSGLGNVDRLDCQAAKLAFRRRERRIVFVLDFALTIGDGHASDDASSALTTFTSTCHCMRTVDYTVA